MFEDNFFSLQQFSIRFKIIISSQNIIFYHLG